MHLFIFFLKEKITKVLELWQKNNIFSNDLIEKLIKLTDLVSKNDNIDLEELFKGIIVFDDSLFPQKLSFTITIIYLRRI